MDALAARAPLNDVHADQVDDLADAALHHLVNLGPHGAATLRATYADVPTTEHHPAHRDCSLEWLNDKGLLVACLEASVFDGASLGSLASDKALSASDSVDDDVLLWLGTLLDPNAAPVAFNDAAKRAWGAAAPADVEHVVRVRSFVLDPHFDHGDIFQRVLTTSLRNLAMTCGPRARVRFTIEDVNSKSASDAVLAEQPDCLDRERRRMRYRRLRFAAAPLPDHACYAADPLLRIPCRMHPFTFLVARSFLA